MGALRNRRAATRATLATTATAAVLAVPVTGVVLPAAPALAAGATAAAHHRPESPEHALVHWINVQRVHRGLHPLTVTRDLTSLAHRHAARMATADRVFHDPTLGTDVRGWRSVGEDVGSASRLVDLEQAMLSAPEDRSNLLGAGFREIGAGVHRSGKLLYVTVVVRQPEHRHP